MRNQLAPFEGGLVSITGRLKEWRKNRVGGLDDLCVINASVSAWDGHSAVNVKACEAKVHHLWVRIPSGLCAAKLLDKVQFVGRVNWYQRSDGTVDLGVSSLKATSLDNLAGRVTSWLSSGWRSDETFADGDHLLEDIDQAIETIETQGKNEFAFSCVFSLPTAKRRLQRYRLKVERLLEVNRARVFVEGRSKPQGLDLKIPKLMQHRHRQAAGFA